MIRIGTSHYVTLSALKAAYCWDWESALNEGRVSVGRPPVAAGGKLFYDKDGRYVVYYPETTQASVAVGSIPETPVTGSEDSMLERVHTTVEDITTACVTWMYSSEFIHDDPADRSDHRDSVDDARDQITGFIENLEATEEAGSRRWWVYTDWRSQLEGVALMCESKHKGVMLEALGKIAEFADKFECINLAENVVGGGVFLS